MLIVSKKFKVCHWEWGGMVAGLEEWDTGSAESPHKCCNWCKKSQYSCKSVNSEVHHTEEVRCTSCLACF